MSKLCSSPQPIIFCFIIRTDWRFWVFSHLFLNAEQADAQTPNKMYIFILYKELIVLQYYWYYRINLAKFKTIFLDGIYSFWSVPCERCIKRWIVLICFCFTQKHNCSNPRQFWILNCLAQVCLYVCMYVYYLYNLYFELLKLAFMINLTAYWVFMLTII